MKYRAAIFDFDGTLVDTLEDLADSMNQALRDLDFPEHPLSAYRYFVGLGMKNLIRSAAPSADGESQAMLMARMVEHYKHNWHNKSKPYPGIPALIAALKEKGLKLAVFSNKPDPFTKIMTEHFFPGDIFDFVKGETGNMPIKPDPAGALLIANEFAVPVDEFIYLGDTNTDMKTGLAAGMFTVGVTWGFRPVAELRQAGAQAIVDKAVQVVDLLKD